MPDDIYCYSNTDVLKNKLNIHDKKRLQNAEKKIVMIKLYNMIQNTKNSKRPKNIYTPEYFLKIHKELFCNIYDFAGEYRKVDIAKGSFRFAECMLLEKMMQVIFSEIAEDFGGLENISKEKLSKLLAKHMANLNVLHPFREGNGRTTREYVRQIAYYFGYILDFNTFSDKEILEAMKLSVISEDNLEKIIFRSLKKYEKNI